MKILVTGAKGFLGKNLVSVLKYLEDVQILEYDKDSSQGQLEEFTSICDFVYHLAGINRPTNINEFQEGNCRFTELLISSLKKNKNNCPIMLASSIQAEQDNPYGHSKREGEVLLKQYAAETRTEIYIYRFSNIFGKWCRPDYNSVVATFCHNIAHDIPIQIHDESTVLDFIYVDDVVDNLIRLLQKETVKDEAGFCQVMGSCKINLGDLAKLIYSFKDSRKTLTIPDMTSDGFIKKLYSTYLSYLPENQFCYPLNMNIDNRGSFTEIMKTPDRGQFSVNIIKPGFEKGNHWHRTKNEKFIVVSGNALIQFKKINSNNIISYHVSGEQLEVVDIPVGYTHNIINEGNSDLVTLMWCNECFDINFPDTYCLDVNGKTSENTGVNLE